MYERSRFLPRVSQRVLSGPVMTAAAYVYGAGAGLRDIKLEVPLKARCSPKSKEIRPA